MLAALPPESPQKKWSKCRKSTALEMPSCTWPIRRSSWIQRPPAVSNGQAGRPPEGGAATEAEYLQASPSRDERWGWRRSKRYALSRAVGSPNAVPMFRSLDQSRGSSHVPLCVFLFRPRSKPTEGARFGEAAPSRCFPIMALALRRTSLWHRRCAAVREASGGVQLLISEPSRPLWRAAGALDERVGRGGGCGLHSHAFLRAHCLATCHHLLLIQDI